MKDFALTNFVLIGNDPTVYYAKKKLQEAMALRHAGLEKDKIMLGVACNTVKMYKTEVDWFIYLMSHFLEKFDDKDLIIYTSFLMKYVREALLKMKDDYKRINVYVIDCKFNVKNVTLIDGELFETTV